MESVDEGYFVSLLFLQMKNLSRRALMLNEKISDAEILTKLPGEKHSSMRTLHKDVFVGVHDATDVSLWDFEEDETSVTFPYLTKSISQEIFGDAQQVSFQVRVHVLVGGYILKTNLTRSKEISLQEADWQSG